MAQTPLNNQPLYTCLSCSIAFLSPVEQRNHYRSDHHRYNMKRRVAGLPPVSLAVFNQKVQDRKAETSVMASRWSVCDVCNKVYATENSYRSHLQSKKHKENELRAVPKINALPALKTEDLSTSEIKDESIEHDRVLGRIEKRLASLVMNDGATEEEINRTIDDKIAAARARLSSSHCLFCPQLSSNLEENLTHMSIAHSFFIPDAEYLTDITGLIIYLGEKIAVGNVCIYCNGKGREFRTLEAVRKHMVDKSHCKIAYDREDERLEIAEYFDFTSSYPDAQLKKKKSTSDGSDEWEDVDDDDENDVDEVVEAEACESDDDIPDNQITYGDSHLELVLPSGARVGHRSLRRYYAQSFPAAPRGAKPEDPNSGTALVRRLLADKNSALVPRKGGFGAYGAGTDVIKARNRGEAREAGRHVREFRDQRRREEFKTKIAFKHNYQKHYRDPLLQ